jgi:hypothetical protein
MTVKASNNVEAARLVNNDQVRVVIVREGFVLDEVIKTLVTLRFPPKSDLFCVWDSGQFREHLRRNGQLFVLVEQRGTNKPAMAKVTQIDGKVLILDQHLPFVPREGACVQLIRAMEWRYIREKDLDDDEKRKDNELVWV